MDGDVWQIGLRIAFEIVETAHTAENRNIGKAGDDLTPDELLERNQYRQRLEGCVESLREILVQLSQSKEAPERILRDSYASISSILRTALDESGHDCQTIQSKLSSLSLQIGTDSGVKLADPSELLQRKRRFDELFASWEQERNRYQAILEVQRELFRLTCEEFLQ